MSGRVAGSEEVRERFWRREKRVLMSAVDMLRVGAVKRVYVRTAEVLASRQCWLNVKSWLFVLCFERGFPVQTHSMMNGSSYYRPSLFKQTMEIYNCVFVGGQRGSIINKDRMQTQNWWSGTARLSTCTNNAKA